MAKNNYQWGNNRGKQNVSWKFEVDLITSLVAKMEALSHQVSTLKNPQAPQQPSIGESSESRAVNEPSYSRATRARLVKGLVKRLVKGLV